jgi:hypothetical protein
VNDPHETRRTLAPLAALGGFVVGLVAWIILVVALASDNGSVASSVTEARDLGLVSFTVLAGYDKSQELHAWLLGCLIIPISTWAVWAAVRPPLAPPRVGRRRTKDRREGADETEQETGEAKADETAERRRKDRRGPPSWFPRLGLAVTALAVLIRPGFLRGPSPWGSFGLLGEEGVYLGAVQALRTGRVLYVDLEFPYGPLMIHPLNLWLRITGDTVVAARVWVLLLHVVGLLGAAAVVRLLVGRRRGPWAAFGVALALAVVAPLFLPNLNGVLLRPVLAFLPAALVVAAGRRAFFAGLDRGDVEGEEATPDDPWRVPLWRCPLFGAGALLAVGGLFSFEIGVAGLVGLIAALLLVRPGWRRVLRPVLGAVLAALPVLVPMHLSGSLGGLVDQGRRMLTLPALGYQALPYPDPLALFADGAGKLGSYPPDSSAVLAWAVIPPLLIWLALGLGLCGARRGRTTTSAGTLLLVGLISAVLFRAALGRSDLYHLWFYGAVPVALLGALLLTRMWTVLVREFRPLVPCIGAMLVIFIVSVGSEGQVRFPDSEEERLAAEAGIDGALATRPVRLRRTGHMRLLPRLAEQIEAVVKRAGELPASDSVYFYPSEATLYFLTDRRPPSRYLWAYDAATPSMQAEAILDLERDQPRWMFKSTDTFEIDHIAQDRLVPQLESYLGQRYRPVELLPGAVLMERVGR